MVKKSVFDQRKPLLKAIDWWKSADANAVISELVRIMTTYVWQTEKQKIAAQMLVFKVFN